MFSLIIICISICVTTSCSNMMDSYTGSESAPSGSMFVNNDDDYTTQRDVTLNMSMSGATQMRFSNDGTTWSAWEDYANTCSWTLAEGHSMRHVYGQFKSADGVVMEKHDGIVIYVEEKIMASDGDAGDCFGGNPEYFLHSSPLWSSYNGERLFIGCYFDTINSNSSQGSVYIYDWNSSQFDEDKIVINDGQSSDLFGFSIASNLDGTRFIASSFNDNGIGSGKAYLFDEDVTWSYIEEIPDDGGTMDHYGVGVGMAFDGYTYLVGSYQNSYTTENSREGASYVYRWINDTWDEEKLIDPDGLPGDAYGWHVAVSGDSNTIIIGSIRTDDVEVNQGAVFIYRFNGSQWVGEKITASNGETGDMFGRIVGLSSDGNIAVVGAYRHSLDSNDLDEGAVYVYRFNGSNWEEEIIESPDPQQDGFFGYSASINSMGNKIIIGALHHIIDGKSQQGAAYLYSWNGSSWSYNKYISSDGAAGDLYGYSVHISGDGSTLMVGAPNHGGKGAVYVY